jgi:hypothetical protein
MHRLIKGIIVAICLHWPVSVSAAPATCIVNDKRVERLIFNENLPTRLDTEAASFFRLKCSCPVSEVLNDNDNGSMVRLSIVQSQTNVYNGEPGIMFKESRDQQGVVVFQGSNSDFETSISLPNYRPAQVQVDEITYSYAVRVSSRNGEPLQASQVNQDYAVTVKFDLSNFPECGPFS